MRLIRKALLLKPGELGRAWPFFALYLLLSAAFTLADGLSLALFVERAGPGAFPLAYGITAAANVGFIGLYVLFAERTNSGRLLQAMMAAAAAIFGAAWLLLRRDDGEGGPAWFAALFVTREIAYTLVLMHFGTYLQDYFSREQLDRLLPVVYAGGRVGGIAGGALLEWMSRPLGPLGTVPVFLGLCLAGVLTLEAITQILRPVSPGGARGEAAAPEEAEAQGSAGGFLRFAWSSPLLFWCSVSSVLFMLVRWVLNYRYNEALERHFDDPAALASFLGRYTQIALLASLVIQLLLVNRAVARLGIGGAYVGYAALVLGGAVLAGPEMTLAAAVAARFLETELRLGLRNPLMQMISNRFSRPLRLRVRAWVMGLLTPLGTGLASVLLAALAVAGATEWAGWLGAVAALLFLYSAIRLPLRKDEGPGTKEEAKQGEARAEEAGAAR